MRDELADAIDHGETLQRQIEELEEQVRRLRLDLESSRTRELALELEVRFLSRRLNREGPQ